MSYRKVRPEVKVKGKYGDFSFVVSSRKVLGDSIIIRPKNRRLPSVFLHVDEVNGYLIVDDGEEPIKDGGRYYTPIGPLYIMLLSKGYDLLDEDGLVKAINEKIDEMRKHPKYSFK